MDTCVHNPAPASAILSSNAMPDGLDHNHQILVVNSDPSYTYDHPREINASNVMQLRYCPRFDRGLVCDQLNGTATP